MPPKRSALEVCMKAAVQAATPAYAVAVVLNSVIPNEDSIYRSSKSNPHLIC